METTTVKKNLFASAAKKPEAVKSSSKAKEEVIITESEAPGFSLTLQRVELLRERQKADETELKTLEEEVKALGFEKLIAKYRELKRRPDSFIIKGEQGGKMMLLVIDKYAMIPDDYRAQELRESFGYDVVTTKTEYGFDAPLLEQYMQEISDALLQCDAIPDDVKSNLITVSQKHSITKGSIERMMQFEGHKQDEFMFNIKPQIQLKNVGGARE